ncbi:MAG TPA: hypothetical protein VK206_06085 [Anaerolineales bacterium]|nr:hypothetical protein [Anaerolineales bacterium]HLO31031.1 hypothetical protein [Anaerolineales bacterium]
MRNILSTASGYVALTIGVIAIVGLVFIILFYSTGGPFGTLNDLCVAVGGILSGILVGLLYPMYGAYAPRFSRIALVLGLIGALLAPIGSALVVFDITGWFLAGLVTTFGYALIGLWLLGFSYAARRDTAFPRRLAQFGVVAGAFTVIGLLAGPGILSRTDAIETAEWFVLAGLFLGGLGWNLLYTIWCIWLSRFLLSKTQATPKAQIDQSE